MPSYNDLCEVCEDVSLPYARVQFDPRDPDGVPSPPFCILMPQYGGVTTGSNQVIAEHRPYDLELYTDGSDMALEASIRAALKRHGFTYQPETVPIGDNIIKSVWSVFVTEDTYTTD